jgi:ketosteroid isomerase-like protein
MSRAVTVSFLEAFADAWNNHDPDAIVGMMTPDCVMCLGSGPAPEGRRFAGVQAIRSAAESIFNTCPDIRWQNVEHFVSGDRGASQWTMLLTGADGKAAAWNGCDLFRFRDGRIAFKDTYRKFAAP